MLAHSERLHARAGARSQGMTRSYCGYTKVAGGFSLVEDWNSDWIAGSVVRSPI